MRPPQGKALVNHYTEFLSDLEISLKGFLANAATDADLRGIFRSATGGYTVFSSFGKDGNQLLASAAGIARRCAILSIIRQLSLLRVELRRMIECALWYGYFIDHPVEWSEFANNPGRGWGERSDNPIVASASAPIATYASYAKALLKQDQSGIGMSAVSALHTEYGNLSAEVHAAMGALHPSGSLALAVDRYDRRVVAKVRKEIHRVLSNAAIVCSAVNPNLLAKLDAVDREWFDWMVSKAVAKKIRGTSFGVAR